MEDLFGAAGTLRGAYADVDWAATPLGPVSTWSPTLVATVRMALRTRFPVTLMWGPEFVLVYNEAYVPMIAEKHPAALGRPAREVFPEIWDQIGPIMRTAGQGADATLARDMRLLMNRHGYLEETFFTFSYSAVTGPGGEVEGVIDIAAETTDQVIGNRRLQILHRLSDVLADVEHRGELIERALPVLRAAENDFTTADLTINDTSAYAEEAVTVVPGEDGTTARVLLSGDRGTVLTAGLSPHLPADDAYLGFLRLVGGTLAQALNRIQALRAERLIVSMERSLSEALQQSLLTHPAQPDGLQVAVRYRSSIAQAHIGGDWYDAFLLADGKLTVAVGDVSGHDRDAAAAMAQIRNMLRGIAYTVHEPPSKILNHLNTAMTGLSVDALATVVLAQIERDADPVAPGLWTMRWSNAGQLPPALLSPDGGVRLLQPPAETLLGLRGTARRSDHVVTLEPGASVVFFTDGLVERRHTGLDEGLGNLTAALAGRADLDAEQLSDHLLAEFAANTEDDIALAVVRAVAGTN